MKDGKALLADLATLGPQPVFVRTHNLLTSGDGTPALKWGSTGAYTEDAQGRPHYDWTIVDRIFDTYLERGLKPYVQIGFMPRGTVAAARALPASLVAPGRRVISTGWAYPPSDYRKWGELVYQWVTHCVSRYGRSEVERGTGKSGTSRTSCTGGGRPRTTTSSTTTPRTPSSGRCRLRASAARRSPGRGLRRRPGSSATSSSTACAEPTTPRARSAPRSISSRSTPRARHESPPGHVQMGIATQLQDIDRGFEVVAGFPELKGRPIVIGESDPDGCAACPATVFPQNAYRNGSLYASYTAAAYARTLRPGREARGQPRGLAHLGIRVRGSAVFRRLPGAGHERHRAAGLERLPDARADGRAAG